MKKSSSEFGKALKKAIANIAVNQDKNKQFVKHELGVSLGRTGDSAIQYWQKGHIPSKVEDIEKLAQVLVRHKGITEKTHLLKFLASSGYPNFSKFYDELSPELSQEETLSFIDATRQDWGDAPTHNKFFGRTQEIQRAEKWIAIDHCRVIAFLGIGGIGKTMVAARVAQQVSSQFDYVIWRSVRETPPLKTILEEFVGFLSDYQVTNLSNDIDTQFTELLEYLDKYRCLLILDNLESIMEMGEQAGFYRDGYDGYGRLIQMMTETAHHSCLILTSREKPKELALLDEDSLIARCCKLSGLAPAALQMILKDTPIEGSENEWAETVRLYGGNPLALKVIAGTIQNLFDGKLADFLAEGGTVFGDIRNVLNEQFNRLSFLEQNIMYWLTVERESITIDALYNYLILQCSPESLLAVINSLRNRSLVEETSSGFTLQNVVMEYMTDRLITQCFDEMNRHSIELTPTIALMKATSKEYIRENQLRLIVNPLAQMLLTAWGSQDLEKYLKERLKLLQKHYGQKPNYDASNIINILNSLEIDINGYDFSNMAIWDANLQNIGLENTDFSHANFERCHFTQTFGAIISIAFSPAGEYIAGGTKTGEILMWELKTRQLVITFRGHTDWVRTLCFSENGLELFSASDDQTVRMWNTKNGYLVKVFRGHRGRVTALAINPEKQIMASAGDEHIIKLWDIQTGICIKEFMGHDSWIFSLKYSPDKNLLLSSSGDSTIKLWKTDSFTCIRTLQGHRSYVWSATFSRDGSYVISGSHDKTIRIWRVKDGSPIKTINANTEIRCVAISPRGDKLAIAGYTHFVKVWDAKSGQLIKTLSGHQDNLWTVEFSPNGDYLASGGDDLSLRFWNISDMTSIFSHQGYNAGILSVLFSPVHPNVLLTVSNVARLWNIQTGQSQNLLKSIKEPTLAAAFHPADKMIACSYPGHLVRLLDRETGKVLRTIYSSSSFPITFSPDGRWLITGWSIMSIWDMNTYELVASWEAGNENECLAFEPEKQLLFVGYEGGTIRYWDLDHKQCLGTLTGHTATVWGLAFNEKTRQLVSGSSDYSVRIWDVAEMKEVAILRHQDQVKGVACSPDGRFIASCGYDKEIRIWDALTFECLHVLQGHTDAIWKVAFNCTGQLLASGSRDGTIRIWDTTKFECIKVLRGSRPYERMNITGATGLTETQKDNLFSLGAIEDDTAMF